MASHQYIQIRNTFRTGGQDHQVHRAAAEHSVVIRMLLQDFDPVDVARTFIPISVDVSDDCLARLVEWLRHWQDAPKASDEIVPGDDLVPVPPSFTIWDQKFFDSLSPNLLGEMLLVANYLEIKPLYDLACQTVVNMIRGKNTDEMRTILNIQSDFTAEQERAIRSQPMWVFNLQHFWSGNY